MLNIDYYFKTSEHTGRIYTHSLSLLTVITLSNSFSLVLLNMKYILILTNIGFIQSFADHFKNIFADIEPPKLTDYEESMSSPDSSVSSESSTAREPFQIPSVKIDAHIKDIRLAVVESHENCEPQALTLKVCLCYCYCLYYYYHL